MSTSKIFFAEKQGATRKPSIATYRPLVVVHAGMKYLGWSLKFSLGFWGFIKNFAIFHGF